MNESAVTGGNPILAFDKDSSKVLFEDMLGSTVGSVECGKFNAINRSAFGESSADSELNFFTGKPQVSGLGYSFLFRNYRSEQGKWQTADPMGFPDGWNNLAYVNNRVNSCIDRFGADITNLTDPNGAGGAGHAAWIIGNDTSGYTTYDYRPGANSSGSGSENDGAPIATFSNFADAVDYLNSYRPDGNQYTEAQTITTSQTDDMVANWAATMYMYDDLKFS